MAERFAARSGCAALNSSCEETIWIEPAAAPEAIVADAITQGLHVAPVGVMGGKDFASTNLFAIPLERLRAAHEGWMPAYMGG